MTNLFINKLSDLPDQYSIKYDEKEKEDKDSVYYSEYRGKQYQYIGSYEKDYSLVSRMWLAFTSLVQAFFSVIGFGTESFQENWAIISTGKQVVKVYCDPAELAEVDSKVHLLGKEMLSPSPKTKEKGEEFPPEQPKLSPQPKKSLSESKIISAPQIDLDKKPVISTNFSALEKVIAGLEKGSMTNKKKAALFQKALDLFRAKKCPAELETFRLANPDQFKIGNKQSKTALPAYFNNLFEAEHSLELKVTASFYDYESLDPTEEDYWTDFANASLGGGALGHGFVQEEIMVAEMPEFANHIAEHLGAKDGWCTIFTREGDLKDRNRVLKGSPNPYLLKELRRVQAVNNDLAYGNKFEKLTKQKLIDSTEPLDIPQKVNILAIAAPKLFTKKTSEQWNPSTLADIFNTLMAGFTLIQEQSENPMIHSGRIGCGVFNNDSHAVYLLHCLAAQQLGVKVKLHGYSPKEAKQFQESWNQVAPQLAGKTLAECMSIISTHLTKNF